MGDETNEQGELVKYYWVVLEIISFLVLHFDLKRFEFFAAEFYLFFFINGI